MSFDGKTNTITIREPGDLAADSGAFFLKVLRDLAAATTVETVRRDWQQIEGWLGCAGRELTQDDYDRFGLVFRSYLARGRAPSERLEGPFRHFVQLAKEEAWPIVAVPPELIPVLNRMMASDTDIQRKRANDALQFATAMRSLNAPPSRTATQAPRKTATPKVQVNWIPLAASIVMLLMAGAGGWPYGFYQLLRLVVFGTAIYVVVQTAKYRHYWPWIMGGVAILFNPILPISFRQDQWQPIDVAVAVVFAMTLVHMRFRKGTS